METCLTAGKLLSKRDGRSFSARLLYAASEAACETPCTFRRVVVGRDNVALSVTYILYKGA